VSAARGARYREKKRENSQSLLMAHNAAAGGYHVGLITLLSVPGKVFTEVLLCQLNRPLNRMRRPQLHSLEVAMYWIPVFHSCQNYVANFETE